MIPNIVDTYKNEELGFFIKSLRGALRISVMPWSGERAAAVPEHLGAVVGLGQFVRDFAAQNTCSSNPPKGTLGSPFIPRGHPLSVRTN